MPFRSHALSSLALRLAAMPASPAVDRARADLAAIAFHHAGVAKPIIALIGGTGTGKSTLVNRLLGAEITAASVRRTHTAGPIAIAGDAADVPAGWLAWPHEAVSPAEGSPARGQADRLLIAARPTPLTHAITLVDTPDLDGDQPVHHAQAERVFRWATGIVFVVTPEKYQMTELPPYARLAARYELPRWFVMNKCESPEQIADYRAQLEGDATLIVVPRDDTPLAVAAGQSLEDLRSQLSAARVDATAIAAGVEKRAADLSGRIRDHILEPLRRQRQAADALIDALQAIVPPEANIDVNPVTRALQKRMQERSILYLMGPNRVLDRVRQAPSLLASLPRSAWDWATGRNAPPGTNGKVGTTQDVPDFAALLADQFAILHGRIDDLLRASPSAADWIAYDSPGYADQRLADASARTIAEEELATLRGWLDSRWNKTPRDTRLFQAIIRYLPGGQKLTRFSEAAPYILAVVVAAHHAIFGPVDLVILGGYSLTAWITERLSDEVGSHTRRTNRRIAERFGELARAQIARTVAWIEKQVPSERELDALAEANDALVAESAVDK